MIYFVDKTAGLIYKPNYDSENDSSGLILLEKFEVRKNRIYDRQNDIKPKSFMVIPPEKTVLEALESVYKKLIEKQRPNSSEPTLTFKD